MVSSGKITVNVETLLDGKPVDIEEIKRALGASGGCEWCKNYENNKDIPALPCANGDMGIKVAIIRGDIVIFHHTLAAGWLDIKYCPNCGRRLREVASE